jgi:hypothetical protein
VREGDFHPECKAKIVEEIDLENRVLILVS